MATDWKVKEPAKLEKKKPQALAKKDFVISHNGYERVIKKGDDLSDVPAMYLANLKTEGVI